MKRRNSLVHALAAEALEGPVQRRARMTHTGPALSSAAAATRSAAKQVQLALSTPECDTFHNLDLLVLERRIAGVSPTFCTALV